MIHVILKAVALSLCVAPSTTMQYVILTYMKHLGVRCKEPRSLESKRVRINFLPKIKVLEPVYCRPILAPPVALPPPAALLSWERVRWSQDGGRLRTWS